MCIGPCIKVVANLAQESSIAVEFQQLRRCGTVRWVRSLYRRAIPSRDKVSALAARQSSAAVHLRAGAPRKSFLSLTPGLDLLRSLGKFSRRATDRASTWPNVPAAIPTFIPPVAAPPAYELRSVHRTSFTVFKHLRLAVWPSSIYT